MSKITLEFYEYQELRDAMAFARGSMSAVHCHGALDPAMDRLQIAGDTLEVARWRDPDWDKPRTLSQQIRVRLKGWKLWPS